VLAGAWRSGEPNDGPGNNGERNEEQFARLNKDLPLTNPGGLIDEKGSNNYGALCECDAVAVPKAVTDAINAAH
jgi:hypothetical protein